MLAVQRKTGNLKGSPSEDKGSYQEEEVFISIDPGIVGTGLAVWFPDEEYPVQVAILQPDKLAGSREPGTDSWHERAATLMSALEAYVQAWSPDLVAIEEPIYFDDEYGQMAAKEGSFTKLVRLVGMMEQLFNSMGIPMKWVPVREWKGQLPKKVVERRIRAILPDLEAESHELDAVGVGLHHRGIKI